MNNPTVKKVIDIIGNNIKWAMCGFAFFAFLGIIIPTTSFGFPIGNYFGMGEAGRAIVVILFTAVYVVSAIKFPHFFGAISFVAALVVVIAAGVAGMGAAKSLFGGGMRMIRWARIWMLIMAIINSAFIAVKKLVFKED